MSHLRMSRRMKLLCGLLSISACNPSQANDGTTAIRDGLEKNHGEPFKLGVNMSTINWWDGNRPFSNLIYGSSWQMRNPETGKYEEIPASLLDANGWVKSVPRGYRVVRGLSVPLVGSNFNCRYSGDGKINIEGKAVSHTVFSRGETRFTLKTTYPEPSAATISYEPRSTDYVRDIDCREIGAAADTALAPEFMSALAGFEVLRFMNWQIAASENTAVSWANRNRPGGGDYLKRDGVPVEFIVETANKSGADPWITMPWNADDDYIARFATYVRDHLLPGRRVYVEVSNEVWNSNYGASRQACSEAKNERLPAASGDAPCSLERYAEKTKQVMKIWSAVFAKRMNRLVRVASFNHASPYWSNAMLGYQGLSKSIDAVATAPYFGNDLTNASSADQILAALPAKADEAISLALQQKEIARKYGLRYIAYEGGQHVVLPDDVPLLKKVERDPRIYDVYAYFLCAWRDRVGDNLNLYNLVGFTSQYGAWGLSEYAGQPLSEAPKLRAVHDLAGIERACSSK